MSKKPEDPKKLQVPKGIIEGLRLEQVLGPLGRTADVRVTINGLPMGLALAKKRKNEVKGDADGKRKATMERLFAKQSYRPTLVMFNNRAFDDRFPWAAFDILGYEAIEGAETETHIGPWPMGDIGVKTLSGTVFCAHFTGPQCVYKLGQLLGTNINLNEWKPTLPDPAKEYWTRLRDKGVLQKEVTVRDFKKTAQYKEDKKKEFEEFLNIRRAERRGDCKKCQTARRSGLTTY